MIKSLLIANRGEIACRIIKTAKRMGIRTIAVYSQADADALHVRLADEAHFIGGAAAADSYLKSGRILSVAKEVGADAIHPGYGLLSESPEFVDACAEAAAVTAAAACTTTRKRLFVLRNMISLNQHGALPTTQPPPSQNSSSLSLVPSPSFTVIDRDNGDWPCRGGDGGELAHLFVSRVLGSTFFIAFFVVSSSAATAAPLRSCAHPAVSPACIRASVRALWRHQIVLCSPSRTCVFVRLTQ